ncbi:hypothetical protein CBR_g11155 [Chara braunii]|uniref:Myb-like domain-containing protein n=1 Tax=Chara braunii TaxID=69332 RepID=A0A388KQL6_CHABU|nr:hypothetical protein CBR_g11155 [Chara braunii]|eukprot:GBG72223.1 hypothetical protein CBR_g11155 [Chara braunii]
MGEDLFSPPRPAMPAQFSTPARGDRVSNRGHVNGGLETPNSYLPYTGGHGPNIASWVMMQSPVSRSPPTCGGHASRCPLPSMAGMDEGVVGTSTEARDNQTDKDNASHHGGQQEPIGWEHEVDAEAPHTGDACTAARGSKGGKKSRGSTWDRALTTALCEALRNEAAKIALDPEWGKFDTWQVRFQYIADDVKKYSGRGDKDGKSCKTKWRELSRQYRKIFDRKNRSGEECYWSMSGERREELSLPVNFDKDNYDILDSFMKKKKSVAGRRVIDSDQPHEFGQRSAAGGDTVQSASRGGDTVPWPRPGQIPTSCSSMGRRGREDSDDGPRKRVSNSKGMLELSKALASNTYRIAEGVEKQASDGERQVKVLEKMVELDERRLDMENRRLEIEDRGADADIANTGRLIDVFAKLAEKLCPDHGKSPMDEELEKHDQETAKRLSALNLQPHHSCPLHS